MDDSDDSNTTVKKPIDVVYSVHSVESSVDPPMEEWSSLQVLKPEESEKKLLYREGLYDPGDGELCAEYITMSASSVLRHPYYNYPAIVDPGIKEALLLPPDLVIYPDDGQALYLATCKEMNQCPVRIFHRALLESHIDLRYYCIDPNGFRAMAIALQYNTIVQSLNLTDNFLNGDACFHMGKMLLANNTITEINLRGCKIGPTGAKILFFNLTRNKTLKSLDLSYNNLCDEGMEHLANAVFSGLGVRSLNLSYNSITGKGVELLVEPFETRNLFTHLDLSWNKIFSPGGYAFLIKLAESECLEVLNLAWNYLAGPRLSKALKFIFMVKTLKEINLSNNVLKADGIKDILLGLKKAEKLEMLNLSYNPMTPNDAFGVLSSVTLPTSKVDTLIMENVDVNDNFVSLLEKKKQTLSKKALVVTYGKVISDFVAKGADNRDLILSRLDFLCKKPKKNPVDVALFALQLEKDQVEVVSTKVLMYAFRRAGVLLDEDIIDELALTFPVGDVIKSTKIKYMSVKVLVEYIRRKWPERQLPPTPPPEPAPPTPPPKQGKKKENKKKK